MAKLTPQKLTPKQEKFCQKYIELGNASEAYRQSYDCSKMKDETVNRTAKELLDNHKITARISQLQNNHAKRHQITVDDLLGELEEVRTLALTPSGENGSLQLNVAVSAIMGKAKILGFDKKIVDNISSDGTMTPQQVSLDEILKARKEILDEY